MDTIIQIVHLPDYAAVFECVNDEAGTAPESAGILARVDARVRSLPLLCYALVRSETPHAETPVYRMVGVILDPDLGYLDLCERTDGEEVRVGRFLGYLPPDKTTSASLMNNYRQIVAAGLDGRYAEDATWNQVIASEEEK
ncbi:MAG TPA: hypothetical protein PKK36_10095 [Kiritimatiellia bacterium]|nr:hypothetical protein [Kiritimatiellia bacterium]HNS37087.1 hypothetical protein [Anaerolineaceae bacterium]